MRDIWEKLKNVDWEEYRRQRVEVTREDEIEMEKALFMFVLRFLWAKIRGKRVVKSWWTAHDDSVCCNICAASELIVDTDMECRECYRIQKKGSKMTKLEELFFCDEDSVSIMCEECADEITDKERFKEHEKKRADILRCRWSS